VSAFVVFSDVGVWELGKEGTLGRRSGFCEVFYAGRTKSEQHLIEQQAIAQLISQGFCLHFAARLLHQPLLPV